MRVRIIGNVWVDGRALYAGDVADLSDRDAERLVTLGVAVKSAVKSAVVCAAPSQASRMESGRDARVPSVKAKPAGKKGPKK